MPEGKSKLRGGFLTKKRLYPPKLEEQPGKQEGNYFSCKHKVVGLTYIHKHTSSTRVSEQSYLEVHLTTI